MCLHVSNTFISRLIHDYEHYVSHMVWYIQYVLTSFRYNELLCLTTSANGTHWWKFIVINKSSHSRPGVQPNVAILLQCPAIVMICCLSVVCNASALWQHDEVMITQFSHIVAQSLNLAKSVGRRNLTAAPLVKGLKLRWVGFWLCNTISQKRCQIELRWQWITNRKLYLWAFDWNESWWLWMILNVNLLLYRSSGLLL